MLRRGTIIRIIAGTIRIGTNAAETTVTAMTAMAMTSVIMMIAAVTTAIIIGIIKIVPSFSKPTAKVCDRDRTMPAAVIAPTPTEPPDKQCGR